MVVAFNHYLKKKKIRWAKNKISLFKNVIYAALAIQLSLTSGYSL